MTNSAAGRLVILSGPSCVGKSPLARALRRTYPEASARLRHLVLFNSRGPRPHEKDGVDYHFRSRAEIEALRGNDRYVVIEARADLQALDMEALAETLKTADPFFEGNPFVGRVLQSDPRLADVPRLAMFVAPLARDEILALRAQPEVDVEEVVADVMRQKLRRRTMRQKGRLGDVELEDIETRCRSCYRELREAHHFPHVIPNHDGEDSENWDAFPIPLGDARRALLAVAALLAGETPIGTETWEPGLIV